MSFIGIDTSNYTTSIAFLNGKDGVNVSRLLPVKEGELGLRQSDAVFAHIKSLPELSDRLFSNADVRNVEAVGVSTRPRAVEGSYMPCFMVGYSHAVLLARALNVPLFEFSHQQGHIAACLWSAGCLEMMNEPHLAWHLSGGTTELLLVEPEGMLIKCTKIGGTSDISAGQLIDRTGQMLKLPFPAGRHLDALSQKAEKNDRFKVRCTSSSFSFSGVQNKVQQYYNGGASAEDTAVYALNSIAGAVLEATRQAMKEYPGLRTIFSGGVSSNTLLRTVMKEVDAVFCPPQYSTDNAMGPAVLAGRMSEAKHG